LGLDPIADVDDELSFHLEMRAKEHLAQGDSPDRARQLAERRFGDYERSRAECVAINERRRTRMTRAEYVRELRQDLGYALRMLRRTPGFTAVALITLALGIGANSAIFSVVYGVVLQSLPYPSADRLHQLQMLYPDGTAYSALSAPDFMSVREGNRAFDRVEGYATGVFTLLGAGEPQEIRGVRVSDGLLELLGLPVALGRSFAADEFRAGQGSVVLLDDGFWRRAFGGSRDVIGRTVSIGGDPYTIVGVLAPEVRLPDAADMYAPLAYGDTFSATTATGRRAEFIDAVGRARGGVTAAQVQDDLRRLGSELQAAFPATNGSLTFTSTPLRQTIIGDVEKPLLMLLGAVCLVLLVACANVANLLLARASARQGELAVRAALGAGRGRLVRQLLTEAVVLSFAGGALGLVIAYYATRALIAAKPVDLPRLEQIGVNGAVLVFTLGISLLTGLVFGLVPALQATGTRLSRTIREGGRGTGTGKGTNRVRATLVVAEMALSVVLLMGAGLLIRSFVKLTHVAPGFQADHALAFRVNLQGDEYARAQQIRDRVSEFESRIRALPGVTSVAATTVLPLSGLGSLNDFQVVGAPPPPPGVNAEIAVASVTPEYFTAVGVPVRRGRGFTAHDHDRAAPVAIINEAAVRRWFPDRDPVGQQVAMTGVRREIVGVIADIRQRQPATAVAPQLFAPYAQRTTRSVRLVVRSDADPIALAPSLRTIIRELDANLAVTDFTRLAQLIDRSVARPRFYTTLLALFAGVGLALAATGIFGVMSYVVAQRGREISIRMALGARAGQVLQMIVGCAVVLAALGALVGIGAAAALGRVVQNQLYEVGVFDPLTVIAVVAVLLGSALVASIVPARRAARLDPATALRGET
jgi:putative ABC transport system permease protein